MHVAVGAKDLFGCGLWAPQDLVIASAQSFYSIATKQCRALSCVALDGFARFVSLVHFFFVCFAHHVAAATVGFDHALALKALESFAHRGAANTHLLRKLVHEQSRTWHQLFIEEALEQVTVGDLAQAFAGD